MSNASTGHGTMAVVNVIVNAIHLVMASAVDAGGVVVRDIAVDMLGAKRCCCCCWAL